MRTRLLSGCVVAGACSLVLAGAAVASKPAKHAFTPAGQALAKAVSLKAGDLPAGYVAKPSTSSGDSPSCSFYNPDQSQLTETGRNDVQFAGPQGLPLVFNLASVFQSSSQAKAGYDAVVRPELAKCLAQIISKGTAKGTSITVGKSTTQTLSGVGDKAVAITLDTTFNQGKNHVPLVLQVVAINKAAIDTVLMTVNLGAAYPGTAALTGKIASRLP